MNKLHKRINLAANLAIIVVLALIGILFARNYLLSARSKNQNHDYRVTAGSKVSLPGVDWTKNELTLLLALDTKCSYCTASAPFYKEIARAATQNHRVQLIAVLPQEISESKQYLNDLNVPIDEVRQSALEVLGTQGTPTLIMVNRHGEVIRSWAGKLPPDEETEVLKRINESDESM
jgi:thioredoxin-related protein